MELSFCKLLAAVSMAIATFICFMIPVIFLKKSENEGSRPRNFRVVSFLSCFGGGVFMATCLLHLFPDVRDQMVLIFKSLNIDTNYPVAEFLLSVGFLLVLITEQIVLSCQENRRVDKIPIITHQHSHIEPHYQNYGAINENTELLNNGFAPNEDPIHPSLQPHVQSSEEELHNHEVSFYQDLTSQSILHSLLLVFALSVHSIFEGLAIGLQSSVEKVFRILVAVLIHKCIIAFTLGLSLTRSNLTRNGIIKGNILFSLTSPIGIIIGIVVVDFVSGLPMMITSGILQGLAAGTFLYVTFFEVLPHELEPSTTTSQHPPSAEEPLGHNLNSNEDRMIKMGCLIAGFSLVSVLILFIPD